MSSEVLVVLSITFLFVSMTYASVGLGGASTYTALLALFGVNYLLIPTIALTLNVIVTSLAIYHYGYARHIRLSIIFPLLITSIPFSYIGGSLLISRKLFFWLLFSTLILVMIRIYFLKSLSLQICLTEFQKKIISLILGGILGYIAGTVGIGGGIYLVPLLIMLSVATEKEAAAAGSVFVWINSATGLLSRQAHFSFETKIITILGIIVFIGALIGSRLGALHLKSILIQKILGIIIILAIFSLFQKILMMYEVW